MARTLTPQDAYALINLMVKEQTGQDATIQAVDTSSFVSVGEQLLAAGTENVLNTLGLVLGRTMVAARPYNSKLRILNPVEGGMYANRIRKISYYSREAEPSGAFNTQLFTNLSMGFDNEENPSGGTPQSTGSMWIQNQPVPLEMNFGGMSTWQDSTTVYEDQLKAAFRDEASFNSFVAGIMTEKANDIESQKEAFNRACLLNFIGQLVNFYADGCTVCNLTYEFNTKFGTNYTSAQLRTTYLKDFTEFMVATVKGYMAKLQIRQVGNHWSPAKSVGGVSYSLMRHTPLDKQRLIMYAPLFRDVEAMVLPEIFNTQYLNIEKQYEGVEFWQNINNGAAVSVVPAIPNKTTPASGQIQGSAVSLDYVAGLLYDEDAMFAQYQLDSALSSPVEARKRYRNIWWTFCKNIINDITENAVLFIMKD